MSRDPVLVLQLQRMGDLILTFPLLLALRRHYAGHELWVAAEEQFFRGLMPLAPEAVFFPAAHLPVLAQRRYAAIFNLSALTGGPHKSPALSGGLARAAAGGAGASGILPLPLQAAACVGQAEAGLKFGPFLAGDSLRVSGFWQLYRAALTQNNRHNAFHWADLHRLDLFRAGSPELAAHGVPRPAGSGRVGLVLGASESAKRPDALFWARLATRLARAGATPLFLGGPAERELGQEVARQARLPGANLCGRLTLGELAPLMRGLDLCITPDTGPMHLADWLGVPVLNLSLGPVHARETGPVSPGQWVLRAAMSCVGCWSCQRSRPVCHDAFAPSLVARVALAILDRAPAAPDALHGTDLGRLRLLRTARDERGLHTLHDITPDARPASGAASGAATRPLLEAFWQSAFLAFQDAAYQPLLHERAAGLARAAPALARRLAAGAERMVAAWMRGGGGALPADIWRQTPPLWRIFAGHAQMELQNRDFSPQAWHCVLARATLLRAVLTI